MAKSRYVILDANVVIDAHRLGFWTALISQYQISVTGTIAGEVKFYEDDNGKRHDIDLRENKARGDIDIIESEPNEIEAVFQKLNSEYADAVDAGEMEAIAILHSGRLNEGYRFCTADGMAIKVLAVLDMASYVVPASKLLESIGYRKAIPHQYDEKYFNTKLAEGMIEKKIALRKKN